MAYRAVLFDLDGTLADTLDDIAGVMNDILASHGVPGHPRDAYRRFVGDGAARLVARALPPERQELHAEALAQFRRRYHDAPLTRTRPYPGVPELLEGLTARGLPMAIVSNKPDRATRDMVAALFGHWSFVSVHGERPGVPLKPDPAATRSAVEALGVPPAEIIFLGDSGVDIKTARAAGLFPAGAAWGFRGADELRAAGAGAILEAPTDLLGLI